MSVFEFLSEATSNKFLQTIRDETQPYEKKEKNDEGYQEQLEEFQIIEAEETEEVGDLPKKGYPKKPKRRSSDSLKALIKKYEKRSCEAKDTGCLLQFISNQVNKGVFDFGSSEKGLTRLKDELTKLSKIIDHMYSNTLTLRSVFVSYTGMFKMYFINKYPGKETPKTGTFVDIVRDVLKGELSRVKVALDEKAKRLREKLDDKYTEEYDDIQNAIIELYRKGMHENATKRDVTGLLIAIETSCGTRKGGLIDPSVTFYSWDQWRSIRKRTGFPEPAFGFGK